YLGDGIAECLINTFARIPKLRVVPRGTAFRYKGREFDAQTAGRELDTRLLVTGRVIERGDRLSVQVELVDAIENKQLWGERFNRRMADIFEVEEEIARQVGERLRARLAGDETGRLGRRHTDNSEAYQLYLKGRFQWAKRTAEGLLRSVEHFEQALAADPEYALASGGMSEAYSVLAWYGVIPPREAGRRSKAAALRAVHLAPDLPETQVALGTALIVCDRDWAGAGAAFRRALEINPSCWESHDHYALLYLCSQGRVDEAIAGIRRALEFDPLSVFLHHHAAWVYIQARRYEDAIEQCRRALELDPNYGLAHYWFGLASYHRGEIPQARERIETAQRLMPGNPFAPAVLVACDAAEGRPERARAYLEEAQRPGREGYIEAYALAWIHVALGESDAAFRLLEKALDEFSGWCTTWLKNDPALDPLRKDVRFPALLARAGLAN
ncbi:MAG: tetratricopeptide repeat protein, partial [Bryobacteraceae bacterium]